jgi:hypothetical protein
MTAGTRIEIAQLVFVFLLGLGEIKKVDIGGIEGEGVQVLLVYYLDGST